MFCGLVYDWIIQPNVVTRQCKKSWTSVIIAAFQIIFAVGSEAVRGGPIAGIFFVFGRRADDGPGDDIARGGKILGDFVGADGCGNVLGDTVVTIIGAVGLFQEDEGLAIIRAGTVEFQAGKFGLEVEWVAGFGFHFGSTFLEQTVLL